MKVLIMKKISILLIACIMFLTSCFSRYTPINRAFTREDIYEEKRMDRILSAIQDKDSKALKKQFSLKVLNEVDNIDDEIEKLFRFIEGDIESLDWQDGKPCGPSSGHYYHGKKMIEVFSVFDVTTDKNEYVFFLYDYPIDTIDPENEGLYTLRVARKADEDNQYKEYWTEIVIPGLYVAE